MDTGACWIAWLPSVLIDSSSRRSNLMARKIGRCGDSIVKSLDWRAVVDDFDAALVATAFLTWINWCRSRRSVSAVLSPPSFETRDGRL
jgi:hypothetical protein